MAREIAAPDEESCSSCRGSLGYLTVTFGAVGKGNISIFRDGTDQEQPPIFEG